MPCWRYECLYTLISIHFRTTDLPEVNPLVRIAETKRPQGCPSTDCTAPRCKLHGAQPHLRHRHSTAVPPMWPRRIYGAHERAWRKKFYLMRAWSRRSASLWEVLLPSWATVLSLSTVYDKPKYLVKGRPTRIKWVRLCLLSKLVSC